MKKKSPLILACVLAAAVLVFACSGRRPFRNLQPSDVVSASVLLTPPDKTIEITEIPELVSYLRPLVVYNRDDSYHGRSGQGAVFTLNLADGTQTQVMAYNPFAVIDGAGYRTKHEPCQALNRYANRLLEASEN